MRDQDFTVAIVGRPNVGKSTLFNRLVGRRLALVDDQPGVTRDRRAGGAKLSDLRFTVMDTAGLEDAADESLEARMRGQTERAILEADLALLLIDARAGVTPIDEHFAELLRKGSTPIALIANKCEGRAGEGGLLDAYGLALGEPVALSAEHGEGLADLYTVIAEAMAVRGVGPLARPDPALGEGAENDTDVGDDIAARPLQLAIVGRPNVGKSTLINRYLEDDRLLTGPEAGITRDSIAIDWMWRGRPIRLIDTAGMRRRAKVEEKVERLSVLDTKRAVDFAHVVVLLLDARDMLEKQDLTIARQVVDEGRALIVAANKWDLVEDRAAALRKLKDRLQTSLPQVKGVPVITLSALEGKNLDKLLQAAVDIQAVWDRRIPTARLNEWLSDKLDLHPPPMVSGRRVKLRYMTQAGTRPPTFAIFSSKADGLPEAYVRYLANGLRDDFDLHGVPLRLNIRQGKNPYAPKKR